MLAWGKEEWGRGKRMKTGRVRVFIARTVSAAIGCLQEQARGVCDLFVLYMLGDYMYSTQ